MPSRTPGRWVLIHDCGHQCLDTVAEVFIHTGYSNWITRRPTAGVYDDRAMKPAIPFAYQATECPVALGNLLEILCPLHYKFLSVIRSFMLSPQNFSSKPLLKMRIML
eukprot:scaffold35913_cov18-Tisochrysis_lutea.AAC.2